MSMVGLEPKLPATGMSTVSPMMENDLGLGLNIAC